MIMRFTQEAKKSQQEEQEEEEEEEEKKEAHAQRVGSSNRHSKCC